VTWITQEVRNSYSPCGDSVTSKRQVAPKRRPSSSSRARPDPFGRDAFGLPALGGPVPDAVLVRLAKLADGPPLWGNEIEWRELAERLRAWSRRWHGPATAAGWSTVQLFGLNALAPSARLQHMGGAFLAYRPDSQTIAVDSTAITLVVRTSSRMTVYKPGDGGTLAWEITAAAERPDGGRYRAWAL
jgi:hypothetical protein